MLWVRKFSTAKQASTWTNNQYSDAYSYCLKRKSHACMLVAPKLKQTNAFTHVLNNV